jgi:hypothetical protein
MELTCDIRGLSVAYLVEFCYRCSKIDFEEIRSIRLILKRGLPLFSCGDIFISL